MDLSDNKSKYYKNPNEEFAEEDFMQIKQEGKVDEFLREFKIIEQPCPPRKLRPAGGMCFHCEFCFGESFKKVKIKKNGKGK